MPTRVAVVGAGPLGLMAMKNLKEDGFDVTGYEARPFVGGLWKYSEDPYLSVAETTILNSSKYRSAISDFPFPEDADDFPTWQQMHRYFEGYCDYFDLRSNIYLNSPVTGLTRNGNQWIIHVQPKDSAPRKDQFDKVVIATGSFVVPKQPNLQGSEGFIGSTLHAIHFHRPTRFDGQNVLLIGLHATTQDVAVCLSGHAKKLYISHRNGVVMLPRYSPNGPTFDQQQTLQFAFFQDFMSTWFPGLFNWLIDKLIRSMSAKAFPDIPKTWKFSPAPSIAVTPPLLADEIYPLLRSGFAEPVSEVRKVTGPKSVELTDGRVLEDIDSIIYCTGYDFAVPFLPKEYNPYPVVGEPPNLYRNTFPLHPDSSVRESLAFLGHGAVPLPGFVQFELLAMAVSQTWLGNSPLPAYEEMKQWHRENLAWRKNLVMKQKVTSSFYSAFVQYTDHIRWLDWAAGSGVYEHFGWFSSRAWAFWWSEKELYKKCMSGLLSPAIWRLFDMGKRKPWAKAREQIWVDNERAERQVRERQEKMMQMQNKKEN